jgi:hypothetical protein
MPRWFSIEATVDVDVDPDDLHHEGWHHESECPAKPPPEKTALPPAVTLMDALVSLHRQAHPSARDLTVCTEDPCRWLTLEQLRGAS